MDRAGPTSQRAITIALGMAMMLAIAGSLWLVLTTGTTAKGRRGVSGSKSRVDPDYARYVGDVSCRDCHPGEWASHSRSGHSRTLRSAARVALDRRWDGRSAVDPERPGVAWTYRLHDGRFSTERAEPGRSTVERFVIDYAFGSGRHATTFVSLLDRDPDHPASREQRLTFFAHSASPDVTPGQFLTGHASGNTDRGRILSTEDTLNCFGCHATATSNRGPEVLDEATMIPNVTCERCHGPGRSHVEAARRDAGANTHGPAMPYGLESWSVEEQLRRCGACHRTPAMVKPGSIRTDNPVLVRHQPVALVQSACFKGSRHTLGCVTCHDPHARASTDRAAYEVACRSCHADRRVADCPISTQSGCLDCHMPRREVARGMIMTDHWIRIIPGRGSHLPGRPSPGGEAIRKASGEP
jgi:cytochrome c554/c'-like protein